VGGDVRTPGSEEKNAVRRSDYLTVEEVASEFRLSESAIYRALRDRRLPGVKILGRWRIPQAALMGEYTLEQPISRRSEIDPMPTARQRAHRGTFRAKVVELRKGVGR
jgi:excisionase family DNA binding protein